MDRVPRRAVPTIRDGPARIYILLLSVGDVLVLDESVLLGLFV
jgi:hypothetical protein